jgi:chromosome segregation ATPase
MDIIANFEKLQADYTAAQTLLEEAKAFSEAKSNEVAEKESALTSLNDTLAVKVGEIANLTASIGAKEKVISDLQAALTTLQATHKTAEAKAVEIVASVGIKPMAADYSAADVPKTVAEIKAALLSINDPIKRAYYYFANKAALFGHGIGGK